MRKFLTGIDVAGILNLNQNEIQNIRFENLSSAPPDPVEGQAYYDTTEHVLYWFDGTEWVDAKGDEIAFGTVVTQTSFGESSDSGAAITVARSDHSHGTPTHDDGAHANINLDALATVEFSSLVDRDVMEYDASSGIWSNTNTPKFTSVDLNSSATLTADLQNIAVITPVQFDAWSASDYRSAEYVLQFTQGENYSITRLLVIHSDTDAAITEYGHVAVGDTIDFVIEAGFSLGYIELTVACSTANSTPVTLKFSRVLFES